MKKPEKSNTLDMTEGSIVPLLIRYSIPLLLGNLFQMLYNTVDSLVVGNFVGKEALAAVGSTATIVNVIVFCFAGLGMGGTVVISRYFGAKEHDALHRAVETTLALTFTAAVVLTVVGVTMVRPLLVATSVPADVMEPAALYLRIFFAGVSGQLLYNLGSGILRAVGDTKRPLSFLIFTSVMNVVLDLLFVLVFHAGIAGVAYATIISQMMSALLILRLLTHTTDVYRFVWKDLAFDWKILLTIFRIGLPTAVQQSLTALSNVFVQAYINFFGSTVMAGWSCYLKLHQFIMLPMQSTSMAATTFVSQNLGAKKTDRVNRGTWVALLLSTAITFVLAAGLFLTAPQAVRVFSPAQEVINIGIVFVRTNVFFLLFNCINHTLAGALRGRGDSLGPTVIMLSCFVGARQLYLHLVTTYVVNAPRWVAFSYPVGWTLCCIIEVAYFYFRWARKSKSEA